MYLPGQKLLTDSVAISYPLVHFDTVSIITSGPVQFPEIRLFIIILRIKNLFYFLFTGKVKRSLTIKYSFIFLYAFKRYIMNAF